MPCASLQPHDPRATSHNFGWNRDFEPALHVAKPGETIHFECLDSSGGQLRRRRDRRPTIATLDFGRINPVTGPVYRRGRSSRAMRSRSSIRKFIPSGVGWTANIPGFGLLGRPVPRSGAAPLDLRCRHDGAGRLWPEGPGAAEALRRTIGVAPAEPGLHSVVPPRRVGGNLDIRDLAAGTTLYLPVEVEGGALLDRRHPCGPGRRRSLRHRHREPDGRRADARSGQGRQPEEPALHHAGPGHAPSRRRRLRGDDRRRAGPDDRLRAEA